MSGDAAAALTELVAVDEPPSQDVLHRHAGFGWELLTRAYLALGDTTAADEVSSRALNRADLAALPRWQCTARIARASSQLTHGDVPAALSLGARRSRSRTASTTHCFSAAPGSCWAVRTRRRAIATRRSSS